MSWGGDTEASKQTRNTQQWADALEVLGKLDLNQAYAAGGYQIDTLYDAKTKQIHYTPKANFKPKVTQLQIELDRNTDQLQAIHGQWVEQKYLYHLSYTIDVQFRKMNLQHYRLVGFEKIGWYDTLRYHWVLECPITY